MPQRNDNGNGAPPATNGLDQERLSAFHGELMAYQAEGRLRGLPEDPEAFAGAFSDSTYRRQLHTHLKAREAAGAVPALPGFNDFQAHFFPNEVPAEEPDPIPAARPDISDKHITGLVRRIIDGDITALEGLDSVQAKRVYDQLGMEQRRMQDIYNDGASIDIVSPADSVDPWNEQQYQEASERTRQMREANRALKILRNQLDDKDRGLILSLGNTLVSGIDMGLKGVAMGWYGTRAMMASDTEAQNRFMDKWRRFEQELRLGGEPIPNFTDIQSVGDAVDWIAGQSAAMAPIVGSIMAGGWAGGKTGAMVGRFAGPKGAGAGLVAGSIIGSFTAGYNLYAGSLYSDLVQHGVEHDDAKRHALIWGAPASAVSVAFPAAVTMHLMKAFGQQYVKNRVRNMLIGAGIGTPVEGIAETIAEGFVVTGEQRALGIQYEPAEIRARLLNAGAAGALMGFGTGAIGGHGPRQASIGDYIDQYLETVDGIEKAVARPVIHSYLTKKLQQVRDAQGLTEDQQQLLAWLEGNDPTGNRPVREQVNRSDEILTMVFDRDAETNYRRLVELNEKDIARQLTMDEAIELTAITVNNPALVERLAKHHGLDPAPEAPAETPASQQAEPEATPAAEAQPEAPPVTSPEITVDEAAGPAQQAAQLRSEQARLTQEIEQLQQTGEDTAAHEQSLIDVVARRREIAQQLRESRRERFTPQGAVEQALDRTVRYGQHQGVLRVDENGRIIVETDTRIIPVEGAEGDVTKSLSELGLEVDVTPVRSVEILDAPAQLFGLETFDPATGESAVEIFDFVRVNTDSDGNPVSVTMRNEAGENRTFRAPEIVEQILFEQTVPDSPAIEAMERAVERAHAEAATQFRLDDRDARLEPVFAKFDAGQMLSAAEQAAALDWVGEKIDQLARVNPPNAEELLTHLEAFENELIANRRPADPPSGLETEAAPAAETELPEPAARRADEDPPRVPTPDDEYAPVASPPRPTAPEPEIPAQRESQLPPPFEPVESERRADVEPPSTDPGDVIAPEATSAENDALNFTRRRLEDLHTDEERFQPRFADFSEETVQSIVEDVEAGRLNVDNIPPILIWNDPATGLDYIIGGHSRLEAARRLGLPDFQVQLLQGLSEQQAIERARQDNTLGTAQTIPELAILVRDWMAAGVSKTEINDRSKRLFKGNSRTVQAFAALNPAGKTIQSYMALVRNEAGDRVEIEKFAKWVGEARLRHPQLNDSHETELFNYLLERTSKHTENQAAWLSFVDNLVERNSFMGELDTSKPLNILEARPRTEAEMHHNQRLEEAKTELREAQRALESKISEIENRRAAGEQIAQPTAEAAIQAQADRVALAQRALLAIRQQEVEIQKEKRAQQSLFEQETNPEPVVHRMKATEINEPSLGLQSRQRGGMVEIEATGPGSGIMEMNDVPFDEATGRYRVTVEESQDLAQAVETARQLSRDQYKSFFRPVEGTADTFAPAEFASKEAETKAGRRLIGRFRSDPDGQSAGVRSIVEFLNDLVGVDLRIGKTQTSRRHPAHYESAPHLVRSRIAAWMYNFHEAGHGLSAKLREADPAWWSGIEGSLKRLTETIGENASAKSAEEGFAEWVRLFVVNPTLLPAGLTNSVLTKLDQTLPGVAPALRDAHRAWIEHQKRPTIAKFRSYSSDLQKQRPLGERFSDAWDRMFFEAGSIEHALTRLERKTFQALSQTGQSLTQNMLDAWDSGPVAVVQAAFKTGREKIKAMRRAREFEASLKDTPADSKVALQGYIRAPIDAHFAMHGSPHVRQEGIRIRWFSERTFDGMFTDAVKEELSQAGYAIPEVGAEFGHDLFLYDKSISKIRREVGKGQWDTFQWYGYAKESLQRFENKGHKYQGFTDGLTPAHLAAEVARLEAEQPHWQRAFDDINTYFDQLALLSYISGEKTVQDLVNIKEGIDHYWPMPRMVRQGTGQGMSRGRPDSGIRRAHGSEQPLMSLDEAIEMRTKRAMEAYYWNNVILSVRNMARKMSEQKDLPADARAAVNRFMVPLHLEFEKVATLRPAEGQKIIAEYLNEQLMEVKRAENPDADEAFLQLDPGEMIRPEQIEVSWNGKDLWRAREPVAVKVVAPFEGGQRRFYEVTDPILFDFFTHSKNPGEFMSTVFDVVNPMTQAWKRPLTHNVIFSAWQIFSRDIPQSMLMGQGWRAYVPGMYAMEGVMNRITGEHKDARETGAMLTTIFSNITSDAHATRTERFMEVLKEGILLPQYRDWSMSERLKSFGWWGDMPGRVVAGVLKPVEVGLYLTGQRQLSIAMESIPREGAFISQIQAGKSPAAAQEMYDKLIGNFGSYPGNAKLLALYRMAGFLNPGVQVFYQHYQKLFNHDPAVAGKAWAVKLPWIAMMYGIAAAVNYMMTSEEDHDLMKERRDDDRMRYMAWFGKGRIPFDYGITGLAQAYGWNYVEEMLLDDPVRGQAKARAILERAIDLPGHPMTFAPPMVKTMIEIEANHSFFFDRPIVPPFLQQTYQFNPEMQTFHNTPEFYNRLGERLGVSPLKVQYFVRNALGNQLDETIAAYSNVARGQEIRELSDIPFIGRTFTAEPRAFRGKSVLNVSELNQRFDALSSEYNKLVERRVSGDEMEDLRAQMRELYNVTGIMRRVDRLQRFIRDERRRPQPNQDRIDRIERQMTEEAREWFERNPQHLRKLHGDD